MGRAPRRDYVPVSVPRALLDDVDRLVASGILGYRSRAEFVIDAIRDKISRSFDLKAAISAVRPETSTGARLTGRRD